MSPILFSLFVEDLELFLQTDVDSGLQLDDIVLVLLLFADDMVVLAKSPEELQKNLNLLHEYCTIDRNPASGYIRLGHYTEIVGDIGPIDMLVNNAAVVKHTPFLDVTKEELDEQHNINFRAAFNITQIRVNSVNPTIVMTAMGKKGWSDPELKAAALAKIPVGRFA
ncbi:L-xylulose reductase-like, partial [Mercenaria mercenaria]|uniref:L-xylulose reductase-like n=1 Tax=Mercenaria mercenaria TaxID=6596 RepID=UPI00234F2951